MKKKMSVKRFIIPLISILLIVAAAIFLIDSLHPWDSVPEVSADPAPIPVTPPPEVITVTPDPTESEAPEDGAEEEDDGLPHDKLFITVERQHYERGQMRLVIPRLSLDKDVGNGTSQAELKLGPCLYEYAQLPGTGNRNVSIAAHRVKKDFYYLDEMTDNDYLYLVHAETVYRYVYESTTVVEQDDWGPIYSQGYSLVTLTTCTPIGVSDHRMIVRARLDESFPYTEDFVFEAVAPLSTGTPDASNSLTA